VLVQPTASPTTAAPTATPTPIAVDLTPAQRAAIQALSVKHAIPADQIHLIKTEATIWPNGCLGVVLPGMMCTQATVNGFKITLEANGQQYEYHTNQDGTSAIDGAQQLATIRLVVRASDNSIQVVEPAIPLGPTYNPAFTGLLPYGGSTAGAAYVLDFSAQAKAVAIDQNGLRVLDFIKNPDYGLALWRGGPNVQPRLAWGTQLTSSSPSNLQTSALDGSQLVTLLTQGGGNPPLQLVADAWSADGQTLYFSKEPVGLGGYIPFSGASSLYQIDVNTKKVTPLIPFNTPSTSPFGCLDALSGDYRFVVEHCTSKTITIRDLTNPNASTIIQPPDGAAGYRLLGSARFSPDGKRVAFAMAKGDPSAEQGWVAVSDGVSGGSKLILTGETGLYYTIAGWLDDQTLLVQSNALQCNPACSNQLWALKIDGSKPSKVADGSLLTVMGNR